MKKRKNNQMYKTLNISGNVKNMMICIYDMYLYIRSTQVTHSRTPFTEYEQQQSHLLNNISIVNIT